MLHWPPPTSWAPTGPAAAGCSLQKSAGLFARSLTTPSRGGKMPIPSISQPSII